MASKNNQNNPDKNSKIKQNKLRESAYCEIECNDVGECEKYRKYVERMVVLHKIGHGIMCGK